MTDHPASPNEAHRIAVAMSGGVDSSVAAALLVEQGRDVIGIMLRLWSEPGAERFNRCCTPEAMALARRVAAHLDIPFYVIDIRETFQREIVQFFIDGYAQGITPNPCLNCNREIRFGALLEHALAFGATALATGHYARTYREAGRVRLLRGVYRTKDQSYALSMLSQAQLARARFPVGEYTKPEIRDLARRFGLPTAERSESQDLCFLAGGDYRDFLKRHAPEIAAPGEIVDPAGNRIGEHAGLPFYTYGQRKGLGVHGAEPVYVLEKDRAANRLVVGPRAAVRVDRLTADRANWMTDRVPGTGDRVEAQVRYTGQACPAVVETADEHSFSLVFDEPVHGLTPGQAAVLYREDEVLGAGIITTTGGG
ncbi:MAG TPA: tRNA 2-thiouridine(34) synthase MnmA [Anaerolineales bacterium]|nr:tRNA 2-thiouridine(34) synthase MnmA [Anaerolineales bacterium]